VDYIRLGIYAAIVVFCFSLGATMNGYRWELKYQNREAELQTDVAEANAKALAEQKTAALAQEKIVDDFQKKLFEIENRAPATRVIRVCGRPATNGLGLSTADSPGSTPPTAPLGSADPGNSGAILDPEPVFAAAARCDAQLSALIEWAKQ
jgi:hypothetical protein